MTRTRLPPRLVTWEQKKLLSTVKVRPLTSNTKTYMLKIRLLFEWPGDIQIGCSTESTYDHELKG